MRNITLIVLVVALASICLGNQREEAVIAQRRAYLTEQVSTLTEVGLDLATKAAELYLKKLFPDSPATMGPAGPVYSLISFDDTVVGWMFVVDLTGENQFTVEEMQEIISVNRHKYFEPLYTGDGKLVPGSSNAYADVMEQYKCIYISNYREYEAHLGHTRSIFFQFAEDFRYKLDKPTDYASEVLLFSFPGSSHITYCFTTHDGIRNYAIDHMYTQLTEDEVSLMMNFGPYPINDEYKVKNREVWNRMEQLATESN
ncbi:hypothetical protein K8R78_08645 [bacterium]|nr:hypothetical protein [bacterium]